MGSTQSVQVLDEEEEEDDDDNEEEDDNGGVDRRDPENNRLVKKVLEQEPEMLPCYASASPLSPQLSSLGTPRLGPSIKVWDPYNLLAPPPPLLPSPPPPQFARSYSMDTQDDDHGVEVYLISHGECEVNLRPEVVGGRCPEAALTVNGKRQARALAVFLNSEGVRFNAVYSSPLDRARATAIFVCQEMSFPEQQIQSVEALTEMSQGHWEGCLRSETYTHEMLAVIDRFQPDFSAPSGESLRQVEFRMVQFLNGTVLALPERLKSEFFSPHQNDTHALSNSAHSQWDLLHRHRQLSRKKSGKSRLQMVTTNGDNYPDDEISPKEPTRQSSSLNEISVRNSLNVVSCIGIFTHSVPIRCLLTGILGCSALMSHKFCVEDSSVTVLQHSRKAGWQIKRLNDTAHLRLL